MAETGDTWAAMLSFQEEAVQGFVDSHRDRVNSSEPPRYSFEDASEIVGTLASGYGKWQQTDCIQMKTELMEMAPKGDGRVPLSAFYSKPDNLGFHLSESLEYLRDVGALDETNPGA